MKDRSTEMASEEIVRCRNSNSDVSYADGYDVVFVSINRYERKKNIELALDALHHFNVSKNSISTALVIAGGYDYSVAENAEYLTELKDHCRRLKLPYTHTQDAVDDTPAPSTSISSAPEVESCRKIVIFRTSVSGQEREALLARADALLYTPDRYSAINDSILFKSYHACFLNSRISIISYSCCISFSYMQYSYCYATCVRFPKLETDI